MTDEKKNENNRIEAIRRVAQDAETKYQAYSALLSTEGKSTIKVIKKLKGGSE